MQKEKSPRTGIEWWPPPPRLPVSKLSTRFLLELHPMFCECLFVLFLFFAFLLSVAFPFHIFTLSPDNPFMGLLILIASHPNPVHNTGM